MAKKSFSPETEDGKAAWFKNFANKISGYAAKYNISPTELADIIASELYFDYWFQFSKLNKEYMLKLTAYKNEVRDGVPAGAEPSVQPVAPSIPSGVPPSTAPGGYARAIALGNSIKAKKNYTVADGQDLGLEGAEITTADPSTFKPVLSVVTGNNGKPDIKWKKQAGTNGIHLYMKITGASATNPAMAMPSPNPAPAGFVYIGSDTQPDYTDNTPLPAEGQTQTRIYKAIYFLNETNIGQFSEEVKITVIGTI